MVSLEMWHITKKNSQTERKGGRSRLVSLEIWHVTNKDSLAKRKKREKQIGKLGNM